MLQEITISAKIACRQKAPMGEKGIEKTKS